MAHSQQQRRDVILSHCMVWTPATTDILVTYHQSRTHTIEGCTKVHLQIESILFV